MQRYALVDTSGAVNNVVLWDGGQDWGPPASFQAVQSDTAGIGWTYANGSFIEPTSQPVILTLAQAQAAQSETLSQACANAIVSGFSSNALGSPYRYPSAITDQSNQQTIAGNANGGSLWCEADGAWALKPHTQVQAQAVVASFATWLNKCQAQLVALRAQVSAATSVDSVQAIAWANPTIA